MQLSFNHAYMRLALILLFLLVTAQSSTTKAAIQQSVLAEPQPPTPHRLFLPLLRQGAVGNTTRDRQLATPQLIEQAFAQGEITASEQALYLAYALYEPQSLPARFHSNVGWYGTQAVIAVQTFMQSVNSSALDAVQQELSRLQQRAAAICTETDGPNAIDSTNFHLTYDTISGGLTITDYLTSLETTFAVEVTQYDWAKPPLCTGGNTCNGVSNPFDRYPVQVSALGGALYGYVTTGGQYSGFVGDNPNTAATEGAALASCMVLSDDYSLFPEGAQAALDATTAHEYVHAIQFGYGDPSPREDAMWAESSASYVEDEVFDNSNSNYLYLWPVVSNSLGQWPNNSDPWGISQYSNFLFFRYAAEQTGGPNLAGGGEDVMQAFWENVAAGQPALTAYNQALVAKGTNLADLFHNYAIAARFSKSCGAGYAAPYCFEEGDAYVTFAGDPTPAQGSIVSTTGAFTGSIKNHYAANWIDLPTSASPYRVTLRNLATGGQLRGSLVCDTGASLTITPFANLVGPQSSSAINSFSTTGCTHAVAVITNQQQTNGNPNSVPTHQYTLSLSAPQAAPTAITIVLDTHPDLPTNLGFNGSFGAFQLDDPAVDDGDATTDTRTFSVAPGAYTVRRNNPTGWFTEAITCTPSAGTTVDLAEHRVNITIGAEEAITCTFSVARAVTISARAFNDLVRNNTNLGKRNAGDPWQEGWTMTVATSPTTTVTSGVTSSTATAGLYQAAFHNLRAGSYTVCETLQAGWTNSAPGSLAPVYGQPCKSVTLTPGQGAILLFGNYQPTTLAGKVSAAVVEVVTDSDQVYDLPVTADEEDRLTD
ncbi:MAG: hypothetical protein DYG89_33725 [Caldilinea sp. CFX5]|nr:hypothetical protein [Caldilinea sp. CFX5]